MSDEIRLENEEVEDLETEAIDTEEVELDADAIDTEDDAGDSEETEPAPQDSVPLAKYMAEKKKRQEAERILIEQQTKDETNRAIVSEYQAFLQRGYPEKEAWLLAADKVNQAKATQALTEKTEAKLFKLELRDFAKSDAFYADAASFEDEIRAKMQKLDCTMQEAYMMVRGPARTREFNLQQEQRSKAKQGKNRTLPTSGSQPLKSKYNLDADDRKALAGLQKAQPNAGWTAEKYYREMKE